MKELHNLTKDSMLTLVLTTGRRTSTLKAKLPKISLEDVLICQSKRFSSAGLSVSIYNLPTCGYATHEEDCYFFIYRPQDQKGTNLWTVLLPGLAPNQMSGHHCLIVPPDVLTRVEWTNAAGRLAKFGFSPCCIKRAAKDLPDIPQNILERLDAVFFSLDQRLDALCRLLIEEAENESQSGPLYLQALARELAASVLIGVQGTRQKDRQAWDVNPSILRSIQQIEECFAKRLCVQEMAAQAGMSLRHFNRCFLHATGYTPHDYLLLVRLNRARDLMTRPGQTVCLKEIAALRGFYDQTHFGLHFRRIFCTTPGEYLRAHERSKQQSVASTSHGKNVLNFVPNVRSAVLDPANIVA